MTRFRPPPGADRGSMSVEAVLIIPVFLLFLALIAAVARYAIVQADVHAAVVTATRVAAHEADSWTGEAAAQGSLATELAREGVVCQSLTTMIDTAALNNIPGTPGVISVSLTCVVSLGDLGVPGLPGEMVVSDSFVTPIDTYA